MFDITMNKIAIIVIATCGLAAATDGDITLLLDWISIGLGSM